MSKVIDVVLRLKDEMTKPLDAAGKSLANHANQFKKAGRDIQRTGRSISKVGGAMTKAITAPLVGIGAIAYKEFGAYDKQMRLVQQTMGATNKEAAYLSNALKKAASESVYGMEDGAEAALAYARAGYNAKQAADMMAPAFQLAAGTGTDLSVVTAGCASTLKSFNEDTEEATRYMDVLAKAQAQANTTVTDLFESIKNGGAIFQTAGWNIEDLATATGVLGDAMISGSEAGTAFKSGVANLTTNDKAIKTLDQLGITITNTDGTFKSFAETQKILHDRFQGLTDVEKTQAAAGLFGKNQMAKWLKLIERSPKDIAGMEKALREAGGTAGEMSDALMEGPGGAIEKLKSNWDIFKKTLGETIAPVITPLIEKVTELMQKFSEMSDEQKQHIVKMVAYAAAAGPVLLVIGKLTIGVGKLFSTLGKLGKAMKTGTGIFKLFSNVSKGSMLGALGAIGIAIGVVIRNWDKITEKIGSFYQKIKPSLDKIMSLFNKLFGWIADIIDAIAMPALDVLLSAIQGIIDCLGGVVDFINGVFSGDWSKAWEGLKNIAMGPIKAIDDALDGIFSKHASNLLDMFGIGLSDSSVEKNQKLRSYFYDNDLMNKGYELKSNSQGKVYIADKRGEDIPLPFENELQKLASGTRNWKGGLVQISERGGEIVDLPSGSRVYPHDESVQKAYRDGLQATTSNTVTVNIPRLADKIVIREDADIDRLVSKLSDKLEKVSMNVGNSDIGYAYQV